MRSRIRFAIALALAALLGGWLVWTSLGGSLESYVSPSTLAPGSTQTYRLNGKVGPGAPTDAADRARSAAGLRFTVVDKTHPDRHVTVVYRGTVPDAFTVGREIVVTGHMSGGLFVARRDSLITLCPSKFQAKSAPPARAGT